MMSLMSCTTEGSSAVLTIKIVLFWAVREVDAPDSVSLVQSSFEEMGEGKVGLQGTEG